MGRKKYVRKREILPDPKFNDVVVAKFITSLLIQAKSQSLRASFTDVSTSCRPELGMMD
jgi:hypothetical protein